MNDDIDRVYKELDEKMKRSEAGIILLSKINSSEFFEMNENDYISLCDFYYILKDKFPDITKKETLQIIEENYLEKFYSDERELRSDFKNHKGYKIYISIESISGLDDDLLEPIMLHLNYKHKLKQVIL